MENMKSLADQLRQELTKPTDKQVKKQRKAEKNLKLPYWMPFSHSTPALIKAWFMFGLMKKL
jgi:hypothetical protein